MICIMDMVFKLGQIIQNIKANLKMVKDKVMENINLIQELIIKDNGKMGY